MIKSFNPNRFIRTFVILLIVAAIPVTTILVLHQTNTQQHAQSIPSTSPVPTQSLSLAIPTTPLPYGNYPAYIYSFPPEMQANFMGLTGNLTMTVTHTPYYTTNFFSEVLVIIAITRTPCIASGTVDISGLQHFYDQNPGLYIISNFILKEAGPGTVSVPTQFTLPAGVPINGCVTVLLNGGSGSAGSQISTVSMTSTMNMLYTTTTSYPWSAYVLPHSDEICVPHGGCDMDALIPSGQSVAVKIPIVDRSGNPISTPVKLLSLSGDISDAQLDGLGTLTPVSWSSNNDYYVYRGCSNFPSGYSGPSNYYQTIPSDAVHIATDTMSNPSGFNGYADAIFNSFSDGITINPGDCIVHLMSVSSEMDQNFLELDAENQVMALMEPQQPSTCTETPTLSASPSSPQNLGTSITLTASQITGCTPEYRFFYLAPGSTSWTMIQNFSSSNTALWNPTSLGITTPGDYQLAVWVRDVNSPNWGDTSATSEFTLNSPSSITPTPTPVSPLACTNGTLNSNTNYPTISGGTSVQFTANATCGGTPEYSWFLGSGSGIDVSWKKIQSYSNNNSLTWNTSGLAKGAYEIGDWVQNQGDQDSTFDISNSLPFTITSGSQIPIFRLANYNNSSPYFYTASTSERDSALQNGYSLQGAGFYAYTSPGSDTDLVPVYRLYNPSFTNYFYTTSTNERDTAVSHGFTNQGIAFYAYNSSVNNSVPIYRSFSDAHGYFYTASASERDYASTIKWAYQGVAFYAYASPITSSPVYSQMFTNFPQILKKIH